MSRQRIVPPRGRFPVPPTGPDKRNGPVQIGLRVLVREAGFGILLWSSVPGQVGLVLPAWTLGLGVVILWTRWFGLLRPRGWSTAVREGLLLHVGVICFANFVWLCFGNAPWWR